MKFLVLTLLLSGVLHAAGAASYDASVPNPTLSNVRYGPHGRNVLDFWKAPSEKPTPLVFVVHGGGWGGNSKGLPCCPGVIAQHLASAVVIAAGQDHERGPI